MATQDPALLIERAGAVALLTLNRPDSLNAINNEIRRALPEALASFEHDPAVRAVVLRGAGPRGFCAGADIKEFRADETVTQARHRMAHGAYVESLERFSKPIIAAIHGICFGGGLEIALACDLRFASADAKLALPEVNLGLIPGAGGTQRLPRLVGLGQALDMMLTGERIDAAEAHRIGLVSRVFPDADTLFAEAMRIAEVIASKPPVAASYVKEAARSGASMSLGAALQHERDLFALLLSTEDRVEAAKAFKEKRAPNFTGR